MISDTISPLRWHLKKKARGAVINFSKKLSWLWHVKKKPQIRILTYHRFLEKKYDPVAVRPVDFEMQLQWLIKHVDILEPNKFRATLRGEYQLDRDAVLITIDDGHRSFFEYAYPLLKSYKIPAILFVCPSFADSKSYHDQFLNWNELEQVYQSGIVIASHGFAHKSLSKLSIDEAQREVAEAKKQLLRHLQIDNPFFAFPFGTRNDFSPVLADMLLKMGYEYCFTSIHGACTPLSRPNLFPRLKIESDESLATFRAIVEGHLDNWKIVDNFAWPIQQQSRL
jgi:peptidoglycan/xylan/chitin deacetylase (PgdA/CDA1 family)